MAKPRRSKTKRSALRPRHKYIFVIGGVMSGVGKGIAASSIGTILEARGIKVNIVKVDPYLNVDAGTMNPTEHGEVFVLKSGLETDQDMGNYERFLNRDLSPEDYMTSGMVYKAVIERERALGYGGKFVEAIPHVRDEIINRFKAAAAHNDSQVSVIEIGGTIGDFQNALFIEAARTLKVERPTDVAFILVSYLPVPATIGEMKTRPTQNAVRQLNSYGVQADIIIARSETKMDQKRREKLAIWCSVKPEAVISAPDIDSIYDVPLNFEHDGLSDLLIDSLEIPVRKKADLSSWRTYVRKTKHPTKTVKIGIVGKYFDTGDFVLSDAYLSVIEAIKFSSFTQNARPEISWINAKDIERGAYPVRQLSEFDGIIVPGGFGETGIEGKIQAIEYVRTHKIPYLGLCYGLQLMLVEYARNVLKLKNANTTEINPQTPHPVVWIMPDQRAHVRDADYGGTMRLGNYTAHLTKDTIAHEAYGKTVVEDRHRHRYEVNPSYVDKFKEGGIVFSGVSPSGVLMEIGELPRSVHPFMLGTQAHPELTARPLAPHPLFTAFIKAALKGEKR
ncbi:MAG: CTP synthase [Patescibacteria group bacterium]